ncbi:alpha-amylase [Candidatus Beckwithbacteria bacterium]|nr:alpha-amylase [Candidatus Beckwithbacteria bacterium]
MKFNNPFIYEINTRVWLRELRQKYGQNLTLSQIPDTEWQQIKNLGFHYVWLMGIWEPSPYALKMAIECAFLYDEYTQALPDLKKEDIIGSPYAVQNYEPNADLSDWQDLWQTRIKLHNNNLGLILDLVPNHTACDHPWTQENPDFYIQVSKENHDQKPENSFLVEKNGYKVYLAHGKDPNFPSWCDTAQLNYFNHKLREAMIKTIIKIAKYCDGLRCDMAMLVLNDVHGNIWQKELTNWEKPKEEFWQQAIGKTKAKFANFIFMAESYWNKEVDLQNLGFDYTYDKNLYDLINQNNNSALQNYLKTRVNTGKWINFIENHDEQRAVTYFGKEKSQIGATLISTYAGAKLFYENQIQGYTKKLPVQLGRKITEEVNLDLQTFYQKLFTITQNQFFQNAKMQTLEIAQIDKFPMPVAYLWQTDEEAKIIVLNFENNLVKGNLKIQTLDFKNDKVAFFEEIKQKNYEYKRNDLKKYGLYVELPAFQSQIFSVKI